MRHLVLVRHARPQVDPNTSSVLWPLSQAGRNSCQALAERLRSYELAHVVTSREPKASETGGLIAAILGLPLSQLDGLEEHHRDGEPFLDGAAFEAKVEDLFQRPNELVFGRERAAEATARFRMAVEKSVATQPGASLALVAHGTVISLFVALMTGTDGFTLWRRLALPSFVVLGLPDYDLIKVVSDV